MIIDVKVPSPGESINEVEIAKWLVSDGDFVEKDQEIAEIESEKATLPLIAPEAGEIKIITTSGKPVPVGDLVCTIDTSKKIGKKKNTRKQDEVILSGPPPQLKSEIPDPGINQMKKETNPGKIKVTPLARHMMDDHQLSPDDIMTGLKRITAKDVSSVIQTSSDISQSMANRKEERIRISVLRRKLSERLVSVKNETAMLTTFNEVDMSAVMELRKKYQEEFLKKHEVKLGLMSFFVRASSIALTNYPIVNSRIDGEEIIMPNYIDIGFAVQTEKGLMVPVMRNAESMTFSEIEKNIIELSTKARTNRITIEEMSGGTFTITNGGIFGSMLSTPLLNPPQSAILGMHKITERPVAINNLVIIRPMMYLALSYDHRIIDGRDSVSFLVKIKELIEDPQKILFNGVDPERALLNL